MYTNSEGIVLRQVKATGGRRMILIFTKRYGKISIGTGSNEKNAKTKAALAIRPFTYGRYDFYSNRDYYNLSSGETIRSFYSIGEDLDKYMSASFVLELTEKLLPDEVAQPAVFSLLLDFLKAMEKRRKSFDTLVLAYEIKLLKILGVFPKLETCASCSEGECSYFSVCDGGMICRECYEKIKSNEQNNRHLRLIYKVEFDIVSILNYFAKKPIEAFERIALDDKTAKELQSLIREYFSYHLDVGRLKSESMFTKKL